MKGTTVKHGVEVFLKEKLNVKVNEAREIDTGNDKKVIILTMESCKEKIKIMKKKYKLKGSNQYNEDDLTKTRKEI